MHDTVKNTASRWGLATQLMTQPPRLCLAHLLQQLLVLQDVLKEDVCMGSLLSVSIDVHHITIQEELDLTAGLNVAIQWGALCVQLHVCTNLWQKVLLLDLGQEKLELSLMSLVRL